MNESNPYIDEHFNWYLHDNRVRRLKNAGWIELPGWFPSGGWRDDFYEYEIVYGITAMMKPAPDFKDWIKFRLTSLLIPEFVKRRKARKWVKNNLNDLKNET